MEILSITNIKREEIKPQDTDILRRAVTEKEREITGLRLAAANTEASGERGEIAKKINQLEAVVRSYRRLLKITAPVTRESDLPVTGGGFV